MKYFCYSMRYFIVNVRKKREIYFFKLQTVMEKKQTRSIRPPLFSQQTFFLINLENCVCVCVFLIKIRESGPPFQKRCYVPEQILIMLNKVSSTLILVKTVNIPHTLIEKKLCKHIGDTYCYKSLNISLTMTNTSQSMTVIKQ